jgi:hypothetical protein
MEPRTDWTLPPLAPRPFRQLAARNYRHGLAIPRGLISSLFGKGWYTSHRRRYGRTFRPAARKGL